MTDQMDLTNFSEGEAAMLSVLSLLKEEQQLSNTLEKIKDLLRDDSSRTFSAVAELLVSINTQMELMRQCTNQLETVIKWWKLLVEDRDKLLLTISTLELEKEAIERKRTDPQDIYGPLLEVTTQKEPKVMKSSHSQTNLFFK